MFEASAIRGQLAALTRQRKQISYKLLNKQPTACGRSLIGSQYMKQLREILRNRGYSVIHIILVNNERGIKPVL